jgi:putative ABC transport system permease protein
MKLKHSWSLALKALTKNKLQTALTMVGMTIGVATVLTMIALGSGAQSAIQDQVRSAGMNLIVVTAGNYQMKQDKLPDEGIEPAAYIPSAKLPTRTIPAVYYQNRGVHLLRAFHPEDDPMAIHDHPTSRQRLGDAEAGLGAAATLTIGDANEIRKIKGVQYVSEGIHENAHVSFGQTRWFTRMHGDDVSQPLIRRAWTFPFGRYFDQGEERKAENVVVVGQVVSGKLFGSSNPVGKTITIWNQPFKVVGVIGSSSWMVQPAPGDDQFDAIYMPVTTVQKLLNLTKLNDITITTGSTGDVTRVSKEVTLLLRSRHGIGPTVADDFSVTSQARKALQGGGMRPDVSAAVTGNVSGLEKVTLSQLGKTLDRASETMTALLTSIAGVSLLVGGIGIMNIMLLSVSQRTREIGIRRAVGAKAGDVLTQFLFEAVTLSLIGGLLGIAIGCIAASAISKLVQWSTNISVAAILISFTVSAAIGIFFGYFPARQASMVLPINSLKHE